MAELLLDIKWCLGHTFLLFLFFVPFSIFKIYAQKNDLDFDCDILGHFKWLAISELILCRINAGKRNPYFFYLNDCLSPEVRAEDAAGSRTYFLHCVV